MTVTNKTSVSTKILLQLERFYLKNNTFCLILTAVSLCLATVAAEALHKLAVHNSNTSHKSLHIRQLFGPNSAV